MTLKKFYSNWIQIRTPLNTTSPRQIAANKQLKKVVLQTIRRKKGGIFELSNGPYTVMTYSEFKKMALNNNQDLSADQIEENYWTNILAGKLDPVYYAIDNEFSLFQEKTRLLNLNNLTDKQSLIHGVRYFYSIKFHIL